MIVFIYGEAPPQNGLRAFESDPERVSSISDGFDELALPRRKSPAGWTLPPLLLSGVLRSGLGLSPRGSETGSRAGQKSFRPGACFFLQRKPSIFQAAPARRPAMMTACVGRGRDRMAVRARA